MIRMMSYAFVLFFLCAPAWALTIVSDGSSDYSIVIPDDPIPAEITAAQELAQHIEKMSGARLPIVSDSQFAGPHGILLGDNRLLAKLGVKPDWKQLGKEGYLLRVADSHLIIAGGRPRGTLYGVYWLLEKHLGCRWFTPDTTVIPRRTIVAVPDLDITGKPLFEYREPWIYIGGPHQSYWWRDNFSQEYVARTRNSGERLHWAKMDQRHGGVYTLPHFGHNMTSLVPFDKYGATHPEYYALQKDGRRQGRDEVHVDLCLTNAEVARAAAQTMLERMRANPHADMFFVGQSDADHYCQCDKCVALTNKYKGRRSGPTLEFVNAIARLVEKEFPDALIGTFAYSNTYRAPANIKAHQNVVIWFCPITRCFCHSLHKGPLNKGFYKYVDELTTWTRIALKIYAYDYNQIYKHFYMPGVDPPLDLVKLPETYEFYRRMGVEGIFVDRLGEMQLGYQFLRYWLMTQMMNDADFDFQRGMDEFLEAYYGRAARHIREFIELACDMKMYVPAPAKVSAPWYPQGSAESNELRHNCLLNYRTLSVEGIEKAYRIFEEARKAVAGDARALEHVESARMPIQYAMLEYLPADDPRLKQEAVSYVKLARKLHLRSVGKVLLNEYQEKISKKLGIDLQ